MSGNLASLCFLKFVANRKFFPNEYAVSKFSSLLLILRECLRQLFQKFSILKPFREKALFLLQFLRFNLLLPLPDTVEKRYKK